MLQSLYASLLPSLPRSPARRTKRLQGSANAGVEKNSVNEDVVVRLKWGATEYHGRLISVDAYMNLQLHGTEEYVNGKSTGTLGQVLIRCVVVDSFFRRLNGPRG